MQQGEADGVAWACHEDSVRRWLPLMQTSLLVLVSADLRRGCGGRWEHMPAHLEARRELLQLDVDARLARVIGCPAGDLPWSAPAVPDYPPE